MEADTQGFPPMLPELTKCKPNMLQTGADLSLAGMVHGLTWCPGPCSAAWMCPVCDAQQGMGAPVF